MHMFLERPQLSDLVHTRQIYIVPSLNPDGSEWDIHTGQYLFWRKNTQPPNGTDQNRNYGYRWGCCGGSNATSSARPTAGRTPSRPRGHGDADVHGRAPEHHDRNQLPLERRADPLPDGYTFTDIPPDMTQNDHATFVAMGQRMQATVGYPAVQSSDLYITDGDWNDWMYGELGKFPFTIELGGSSFYPGPGLIPVESERVRRAVIFVATVADCPPRVAHVADAPPTPGRTPGAYPPFDRSRSAETRLTASLRARPKPALF